MELVTLHTPDQLASSIHLTFPYYRQLLLAPGMDNVRALLIADGHTVAALALWRQSPDRTRARLLSLMVDRPHRRQGVARWLLNASLQQLQCARAEVYWSSRLPAVAAFEATLLACGWSSKRLDQRRVSGTAASARDWAGRRGMDRMLSRPGLHFDSFAELDETQRHAITMQAAAAGIAESWWPFTPLGNQRVVPELSLIMRWHGRLAGWLATTETDPGQIWYFRLVNVAAPRSSGAMMPLIVEVNRRHFLRDGPDARWRWNTAADQPRMLAFLDRHAAEFCDFFDHHWVSDIVVSSTPG
jgi:GNAT superfamily N-acetyltransferase